MPAPQPAVEISKKDLARLRARIEQKIGRLVDDPSAKALRSVAEVWLTLAKKRTPVDTGVLRASGHVQGPTKTGKYWQVRIVFGGPAAPYAKVVHENLTIHHGVGQAKYLESVTLERNLTRDFAAFMSGGTKLVGAF